MRALRIAMASPVVINSSSPTSLRLPTITPPSGRNSEHNGKSSSPGLPSPSTFVHSKATGLKSGSRAQAIPAYASFGFATARSAWRENRFDDNAQDGSRRKGQDAAQGVAERSNRPNNVPREDSLDPSATVGKLKKPKKPARRGTENAKGPGCATLDFQQFACGDAGPASIEKPTKTKKSKSAAPPPKQAAVEQTQSPRRLSMDISEYAFGVYDLGMQTQAPAQISAAQNPRKTTALSKEAKDSSKSVSRPRKKKAKSDAVILNSDDPVAGGVTVAPDQGEQQNNPVTMQSKPSKKRASKQKCAGSSTKALIKDRSTREEAGRAPGTDDAVAEKSAYFTAIANVETIGVGEDLEAPPAISRPPARSEQSPSGGLEGVALEMAAPRRRNWTPVKDTEDTRNAMPANDIASPTACGSRNMRLTDLLGNFSYVDDSNKEAPVKRTCTGEALTKRRRIELDETATVGHAVPKHSPMTRETPEPKQKKKAAGRKKLPTITALATAAYGPAQEEPATQTAVSEFFAPSKERNAPSKPVTSVVEKPKKPRKPRKKKEVTVQDSDIPIAQPKKAKKARVKFNDTDYLTKLYSPTRATAQMKQQDFLFGTSSQLAVAESPTFIRDMQAAVLASEEDERRPQSDAFASQMQSTNESFPSQLAVTPRRGKSCARVATAPHGTCLSLGQAYQEMWCVSSRDHEGGFLHEPMRESGNREENGVTMESHTTSMKLSDPTSNAHPPPTNTFNADPTDEVVGQVPLPAMTSSPRHADVELPSPSCKPNGDIVIDLSNTSPSGPQVDQDDSGVAFADETEPMRRTPVPTPQEEPAVEELEERATAPEDDDSWMLLSSDGPQTVLPPDERVCAVPIDCQPSPPKLAPSTSPRIRRDVLQPLDANIGLLSPAHSKELQISQACAFSTTAAAPTSKSTTSRPRGRPRKAASVVNTAESHPKKRGRSRKESVIASDPSPETAKFKKPQAAMSTSQPLHSPSEWLDVDEISDSDAPVTPSPPRRRASASPAALPALDVTIDGSSLVNLGEKAPAVISAASTFKPGEPQWPAIREQMFPKISRTIKNAPRSTDPLKPSWYQKILMYDPITLEEITAWLNEQGLGIEVQRQKPKIKKRGRKKRDADGNVLESEGAVEWEVHEEPLQAWMVQKWCEERSICCVWAGGGWGGRTRH